MKYIISLLLSCSAASAGLLDRPAPNLAISNAYNGSFSGDASGATNIGMAGINFGSGLITNRVWNSNSSTNPAVWRAQNSTVLVTNGVTTVTSLGVASGFNGNWTNGLALTANTDIAVWNCMARVGPTNTWATGFRLFVGAAYVNGGTQLTTNWQNITIYATNGSGQVGEFYGCNGAGATTKTAPYPTNDYFQVSNLTVHTETYVNMFGGGSNSTPTPVTFNLPSNIWCAAGTEFNLYSVGAAYKNDSGARVNWSLGNSQGNGFALAEGLRVTATNLDTWRTQVVTLTAGNAWTNLTTTATLISAPTNAGAGVTRAVLLVGDSTTSFATNDPGSIVPEVSRIFATNSMAIAWRGTCGASNNLHEGRAGWSFQDYAGTRAGNPFTNVAGALDFRYYATNRGITLASNDWVIFQLGINDLYSTSGTAAGTATAISNAWLAASNLVRSVTNYLPTLRVGISTVWPGSGSQDASGNAANDYAAAYNRDTFRLAVSLWNSNLVARYRSIGATAVIPTGAVIDDVWGWGTTSAAFSSRVTNVVARYNNMVHPGTNGYNMIADGYFHFLKANQ